MESSMWRCLIPNPFDYPLDDTQIHPSLLFHHHYTIIFIALYTYLLFNQNLKRINNNPSANKYVRSLWGQPLNALSNEPESSGVESKLDRINPLFHRIFLKQFLFLYLLLSLIIWANYYIIGYVFFTVWYYIQTILIGPFRAQPGQQHSCSGTDACSVARSWFWDLIRIVLATHLANPFFPLSLVLDGREWECEVWVILELDEEEFRYGGFGYVHIWGCYGMSIVVLQLLKI